jgi:ABC-2 type transport system permease protein
VTGGLGVTDGLLKMWAVFRREVGGYFLSPVAYVVLFLFALTQGAMFFVYADFFADHPRQITKIIEGLFGFALFWVLPLSPLLTMRLFAEEKRTGSIEMLMTAPVSEWQVVLGKFFAAQLFYMLIWLSMVPLLLILEVRGDPDWGPVLSIYVGLFGLGLVTNSLGVLTSAGTRNQLVAAVLALTGNLALYLVSMTALMFPDNPDVRRVVHYLSFSKHFGGEYSRGIVDLRYILFYLSFTALFLFFSVRVVEARKWR